MMSNLPLVYAMNPHCKSVRVTDMPVPGATPDGDRPNGLPPHEKNGAKRRSSEMVPCSIPVPCSICEQNPPRCITLSVHRSRKRVTPRFPLPDEACGTIPAQGLPRVGGECIRTAQSGAMHFRLVRYDTLSHPGANRSPSGTCTFCKTKQNPALTNHEHTLVQKRDRTPRQEPHDKDPTTIIAIPHLDRHAAVLVRYPLGDAAILVDAPHRPCLHSFTAPPVGVQNPALVPPTDPACTPLPPLLSESRTLPWCPPPTLPALLYLPLLSESRTLPWCPLHSLPLVISGRSDQTVDYC